MNFFEIMKYFARAIEQMRAVDGILIPQFPWPKQQTNGYDCRIFTCLYTPVVS